MKIQTIKDFARPQDLAALRGVMSRLVARFPDNGEILDLIKAEYRAGRPRQLPRFHSAASDFPARHKALERGITLRTIEDPTDPPTLGALARWLLNRAEGAMPSPLTRTMSIAPRNPADIKTLAPVPEDFPKCGIG